MSNRDPYKRDEERPEYRVYRSRPNIFSRLFGRGGIPGPDDEPAEPRARRRAETRGRTREEMPPAPPEAPRPPRTYGRERAPRGIGRRLLRWALLLAGLWILVSIAAFAISAQIQSFKLSGDAKDALTSKPFLLANPQNILVIGTDARSPDTLEPGAATSPECYKEQARGETPSPGCVGTARADTLMVVRAGGRSFRQLSIPRDSYAEIPGNGAQKINAAYAFGGAALQIETVEQFLGIDLSHVIILDFDGFADLIDALGGVKVDVPRKICGDISGGAANGGWTIRLARGSNTLDGQKALAYARLRKPSPCPGPGKSAYAFGYSDLDRAAAQQSIIQGIKGRLTNPLRLPYNFIRGPWIGWAAPKAFISDMGALTLPQLVLSTAVADGGDSEVLCGSDPTPCGAGPGGSIDVPASERDRARAWLLDG